MVLSASLLNAHPWSVPYNAKWINSGKGEAPYPTPRRSCYLKMAQWVTHDNGPPNYTRQIF